MPNSNDLYNTDGDSDNDFADQLSPSDGYFASGSSSNAVPNVPNVIVPDPTARESKSKAVESKAAESKAQEARQEALLNNRGDLQPQALSASDFLSRAEQSSAPSSRSDFTIPAQYTPPTSYAPSSSAYISSATRQPLRTHQAAARTPSLYSEAPPAYTPSQATPLSPTAQTNQSNQGGNYNTFSPNMGVENERLLGRDPESMAEPDGEQLHSPRWSRRFRKRLPLWLNWKIVLFALVLMVVAIGFLTSGYKAIKDDNKKTITPTLPNNGTTRPSDPTEPTEPEQPSQPAQPGSPAKDPLVSTYCLNAQYRFPDQILAVDFSQGQNLTFVQDMSSNEGNVNVKVGGQVNIRKLDDGGYPRVVLELVTNDDMLRLDSLVDQDNQAMKISIPKKFHSDNTEEPPCVEMRATIWVPENGNLEQLRVQVIHLDILTLDDLSIHVSDFSKLSTIVGDVVSGATKPRTYELPGLSSDDTPDFVFIPAKQSYTLDSRIIEIGSTTGDIVGNWPLYDLLGLHVTSGNIKSSITPKPVLESNPKSAVLSVSSVSGSIHANEPIHEQNNIPIRDYLVDIKSTSGGIRAALAFGEGIELKSTASDIAVDLLPVFDADKLSPTSPAQLETVTTSGNTAVRILEPIWFGQRAAAGTPNLDCLQAVHKSTSANVGLKYPQSWTGNLEAETTSGKLKIHGKDVRVTKSIGGWGRNLLEGYKGKNGGGSTISVKTMLGSLDALIGDER
ncbi:hypothetical protein BKA67DRAFT_553360 [Truncatella angustata]|uniref:Adhesin domain-containing protein n=1 Tax=Truncatella angustata TaxID=152316 RepID=A0A9P8URL6_9PEZI|nr:uncharacterized protein BKA67DRAFT_553360 [Truncatella angustata]KAH6656842.1 hypothetical protein BKA67DRAFT_553360 [Truncatella angustata]KAH8193882.1 hypothetical protein TruAng_011948 [Truncatella angustata]